jgi:alkaline phosphatase
MAVYRSHVKNVLSSNSTTGCTVHAYGVKVGYPSYGNDLGTSIRAMSGKPLTILEEAQAAGKAVGLINTSELTEPGTGAFLVRLKSPSDEEEAARQMIEAKPNLILAGGETLLLPEGTKGHHGAPGQRKDGKNLIVRAKELGYTVVYDRAQLLQVPLSAKRVLGVFAAEQLFNRHTEEEIRKLNIPVFVPAAPSLAEMSDFAVRFLAQSSQGFFLVMNDEATDDFSGDNNARDALAGLHRSDDAVGVLRRFTDSHPQTTLLVTADAGSGGFTLLGRITEPQDKIYIPLERNTNMPATIPVADSDAPLDGRDGTGSPPFVTAPDQFGREHLFAVSWGSKVDDAAGILARAAGMNAQLVQGNLDNTGVYRVLYESLFGIRLPLENK